MKTETIDALTRRDGERYFSYIKRCKQNAEARRLKLNDIADDIQRCVTDLPNRWSDLCRYAKAYGILVDEWRKTKQ
jgi:hypothetical protein